MPDQPENIDIEHLTKAQLILLTLFVSFITSIATGIVTVSLMNQAPPVVAQTVNRVIERTVEQALPTGQPATVATTITKEKTVVVKDSDLLAQAIQKTSPSIVKLYTRDGETFLGFAFSTDNAGALICDSDAIGDAADVAVKAPDGTMLRAFVTHREATTGLVSLQATTSTSTMPAWVPATISADPVQVGQSVAIITGKVTLRVSSGIVTAIMPTNTDADTPRTIDTDLSPSLILPGTILITDDGAIIGMSTGAARAVSAEGFVPLASLLAKPATSPGK